MEIVRRNTAFKVWVADLLNSKYAKGQDQFDSGYVEVRNNKVSRVNLVGSVVDKFTNESSLSFGFDDGSGILKLRCWSDSVNLFSGINIGDLVLVVGKIKEYGGFIYVVPEIIKLLDNPLWLKVRKLELVGLYGEVKRVDGFVPNIVEEVNDDMSLNVVEEKVVEKSEGSREFILSTIEKLDFGDGADLGEVVKKCGFNDIKDVINDLILCGEVFELHKGKLRVTG